MATITPVAVDIAGEAVPFVAATAGGDTIATAGKPTQLIVTNGSASPVTVTLAGAVVCSQGGLHNATETVAASTTQNVQIPGRCIPPSGNVAVTYSAVTSVTIAATQ